MTFGFYHSMVTIPNDLQEAATNFRLSPWQRFGTLEVPSSMHSLIWNSMMSFGGGWFFVAQSEAITVLNKNIKLPGLGSYMATAVEKGDNTAAVWAIVAMLAVILASDQLVWRPLLAWADKFKMELVESGQAPQSWLYSFLRRAYIFPWIEEKILQPVADAFVRLKKKTSAIKVIPENPRKLAGRWIPRILGVVAGFWLAYQVVLGVIAAVEAVYNHISWGQFVHLCFLGSLTMGRVAMMTIMATLIWTPIGVWIGSKPNIARFAQPFAQIAASFPVNMTFPFVVGFFVAAHIGINWGSILLIAMGTQWYILFNVIAGAMAIPNDLKEAARTYGLSGWATMAHLDFAGDISLLGDRCLHCSRGSVERQYCRRTCHMGKYYSEGGRSGRLHRRGYTKGGYTDDHLQHCGDVHFCRNYQQTGLAQALRLC